MTRADQMHRVRRATCWPYAPRSAGDVLTW